MESYWHLPISLRVSYTLLLWLKYKALHSFGIFSKSFCLNLLVWMLINMQGCWNYKRQHWLSIHGINSMSVLLYFSIFSFILLISSFDIPRYINISLFSMIVMGDDYTATDTACEETIHFYDKNYLLIYVLIYSIPIYLLKNLTIYIKHLLHI